MPAVLCEKELVKALTIDYLIPYALEFLMSLSSRDINGSCHLTDEG